MEWIFITYAFGVVLFAVILGVASKMMHETAAKEGIPVWGINTAVVIFIFVWPLFLLGVLIKALVSRAGKDKDD